MVSRLSRYHLPIPRCDTQSGFRSVCRTGNISIIQESKGLNSVIRLPL